jgi:Chaperone of endosialidase
LFKKAGKIMNASCVVNPVSARCVALALGLLSLSAFASTCPFDTGGSDAMNDGVVLTRYALGIAGNPLVASTRYASLDPLQVKNNIECVGCALDINGDGQIDTVDTTIIARHLVGFKDTSLTNGLTLGSGSRNTTATVTSFLANGCAVGGALNAFTLGGNAFGNIATPAVLGTTDGRPLSLGVGDGSGLRMAISTGSTPGAIAIVNGSVNNASVGYGSTVAGGGFSGNDCYDYASTSFTRSCGNVASAELATVGGGYRNIASGSASIVSGGGGNTASDFFSSVLGGRQNTASGYGSTVAGGLDNVASGISSFAAGRHARALHDNAFVWGGSLDFDTVSSAAGQFRVFAPESIRMYASLTSGAGCILSTPSSGWACSSDRDMKTNIRLLNTLDVLKRVIAMPLSSWAFKGAEAYTHIGPMAQDFSKAFALGADDKTISAMDSSGVALAAIQGLHKLLKDKDAKIVALENANAAMLRDVGLMKKRLGM